MFYAKGVDMIDATFCGVSSGSALFVYVLYMERFAFIGKCLFMHVLYAQFTYICKIILIKQADNNTNSALSSYRSPVTSVG